MVTDMTDMKRLLTILLAAIVLATTALAETKIVDKSAKKAPEWLGTATEGFLVVTVRANSLADAQSKALDEITERIIKSVASNVTVSQTNVASEVTTNSGVDSRDEYTRTSRIRSANLPFLKGISLSNAADIYWVRLRDKQSGREFYDYSVKYPFSRQEQQRLSAQLDEIDGEKSAQYKELEEGIDNVGSLDEIKSAIASLDALGQYFFDDVRLAQAKSLRQRYKDLYRSLILDIKPVAAGSLQCRLMLNGRTVKAYVPLTVKSNCAMITGNTPADGVYTVTYDTQDCLPDEDNTITASLRVDGRTIENRYLIGKELQDAAAEKFSVVPEGKIILTADSVSAADRTVAGINIRLTLNNRGTTPFGLKSIELHLPQLTAPIVFDDIDGVYSSKGIIQINARADGCMTVRESKRTVTSLATGSLTLVNPTTGSVERIRLALPYVTNWD